jgi:hypothetical protein
MAHVNQTKSVVTTVRFQPRVKNALQLMAALDGRSMSSMIEVLIKDRCEQAGLGWPPKRPPKT